MSWRRPWGSADNIGMRDKDREREYIVCEFRHRCSHTAEAETAADLHICEIKLEVGGADPSEREVAVLKDEFVPRRLGGHRHQCCFDLNRPAAIVSIG